MQDGLNFQDWNEFFKKIPFTFFRTSLIQKKYIETIDKFTPDGGRLLEIAGGSGYTSAVVADLVRNKNATVTMSDLEPKLVRAAASKYSGCNMLFEQADSFDLSKFDEVFDVVFHQGFLEHFDDNTIIKFLKEQSSISHFVIFDVPNCRRWNKSKEFGNERFLTHKEWINLVKKAGLMVEYHTARRFTNKWKKWVPIVIRDSEWFHRGFGEASIIVCKSPEILPSEGIRTA